MNNTRYFIPFNQLKDTLHPYNQDYKAFIATQFQFTVLGKKLYVCRQDGVKAEKPLWADLLSDCAMELLAEKVKSTLESLPNAVDLVKPENEKDLYDELYAAELKILEKDFEVPTEADMDKKSIALGETCFDRGTVEYVTYIGMVPSHLILDGNNAIVRDSNNNLRAMRMCDLVSRY